MMHMLRCLYAICRGEHKLTSAPLLMSSFTFSTVLALHDNARGVISSLFTALMSAPASKTSTMSCPVSHRWYSLSTPCNA
eukprot:1296552-Pyramimonas_sp.AAC.1